MAVRNTFTPTLPDEEQPDDPYAIFGSVLPAAPAMPMDGGNNGVGVPPPTQGDTSFLAGDQVTAPTLPAPPPPVAPVASAASDPYAPAVGQPVTSGVSESGLKGLYTKYYGTDAPPVSDFESNYGNPGGLSAVEALMQADPNNILNRKPPTVTSPPPGTITPPRSTSPSILDSPLSGRIDTGLTDLINAHGATPEEASLLQRVNAIIAGGGALPADSNIEQQQLESARENESRAFTSQLGDARDELASRGLDSEPGVPQGQEGEAISTISRNLATPYSQAVRDIKTSQMQTQENRLQSAIATATGLDTDAAHNLLATLGTGTQRQVGLAQIALDSLQQNASWNEFLATYGLNRDQVLNSIQSGNANALLTLISLFEQQAATSAKGHV